jgi:biotin carboxyl carrier protein
MLFEALAGGHTVKVEVRRRENGYTVTVDGRALEVDVQETSRDFLSLLVEGRSYEAGLEKRAGGYRVLLPGHAVEVDLSEAARGAVAVRKPAGGPLRVSAPMPGKIVRVGVEPGQDVTAGQPLLVMEAMKMENEIRSPRDGRVKEIAVRAGQAVETGAVLAVLE